MIYKSKKYFVNKYLLDNMVNHVHNRIYERFGNDEKNSSQKEFEMYLKENKILIIDYVRLFGDPKYFETMTHVTRRYTYEQPDKLFCLWNTIDNTYKSELGEIYKWDIPTNQNIRRLQIYKNLYDFLFVDEDKKCDICSSIKIYYFCYECKRYICKSCTFSRLRWILIGNTDKGYIKCNCGRNNFLYNLPSHYDF